MCFGDKKTETKTQNTSNVTSSNVNSNLSDNSKSTGSNYNNVSLPSWLTDNSHDVISGLGDLATNGPGAKTYTGQLQAGLSPDEQNAYSIYRSLAGSTNPYTAQAEGAYGNLISAPAQHVGTVRAIDNVPGAPGTAGGSTQDYMDPYLRAVLTPQLQDLSEQGVQNQQKANAVATMGGAFGDARSGFEAARNTDLTNRLRQSLIGTANSNAFNNAMGLKEADINRNFDVDKTNAGYNEQALARGETGAKDLTALDQSNTTRQAQVAGLLQQAGLAQRQNDQAGLDKAYAEFQRMTGYPLQVAQSLIAAINGSPATREISTTGGGTVDTSRNVNSNQNGITNAVGNGVTTTEKPDNSGWGLLGSLAGSALGSVGGPVGSAIGNKIAGSLTGGSQPTQYSMGVD